MEAAEKAKYLVQSFSIYDTSANEVLLLRSGKNEALICVDEMKKSHENYSPNIHNMASVSHTLDFLDRVISEINKL